MRSYAWAAIGASQRHGFRQRAGSNLQFNAPLVPASTCLFSVLDTSIRHSVKLVLDYSSRRILSRIHRRLIPALQEKNGGEQSLSAVLG
jgi:hypothetical protein